MIGFNKHKVIEKVSHPNPSAGIQQKKNIETRESTGNSAHFFGGAKIHNCTTSGLAAASCQDNAGSKSPQGDFPPVKFNCKSPRIFLPLQKECKISLPKQLENHPKKQTNKHRIKKSDSFNCDITWFLHYLVYIFLLLGTRKLFLATCFVGPGGGCKGGPNTGAPVANCT